MNQASPVIKRLLDGETIEDHREGGNSMSPIIKSREPVRLLPILDPAALTKGDIVLVKCGGNIYIHLIHATKEDQLQIGNNHGHMNGWTPRTNAYGIVTAINGTPRRNSQYPVHAMTKTNPTTRKR